MTTGRPLRHDPARIALKKQLKERLHTGGDDEAIYDELSKMLHEEYLDMKAREDAVRGCRP